MESNLKMSNPPKKILVLFPARARNIGDMAILKGHVKLLKKMIPGAEITIALSIINQSVIAGAQLKKHPFIYCNRASRAIIFSSSLVAFMFHISRRLSYNLFCFFDKALKNPYCEYDLIINAHGTLIKGESEFFDGLFNVMTTFFALTVFGAPLVIGPTSAIGPFNSKINKMIIRTIYSKADAVFVREHISEKYLLYIGVPTAKVHYINDTSFWLDQCSSKRTEEILSINNVPNQSRLIAVIPNSTIYRRFNSKSRNEYLLYAENMARYIDWIIQTNHCKILLIPFQFVPDKMDGDEKTCRDILNIVRNRESVYHMKANYEPEEMKGLFACCELVISHRLHPGLFAVSVGTPSVIIAADRQRALGIIGEIYQMSQFVVCAEEVADSQEMLAIQKEKTTCASAQKNIIVKSIFSPNNLSESERIFRITISGILRNRKYSQRAFNQN